jgi:hypothetical protein
MNDDASSVHFERSSKIKRSFGQRLVCWVTVSICELRYDREVSSARRALTPFSGNETDTWHYGLAYVRFTTKPRPEPKSFRQFGVFTMTM